MSEPQIHFLICPSLMGFCRFLIVFVHDLKWEQPWSPMIRSQFGVPSPDIVITKRTLPINVGRWLITDTVLTTIP